MLERLIAKYGVLPLAVAAAILCVVLYFGAVLGVSKVKGWFYQKQAERAERMLEYAKAEIKAKAKDLAQTDKAGQIAADTTAKQDETAKGQRQNTAKAVEVIHERIVQVPIAVLPADDRIVRQAVHQARARATAAQDRVQRAPAD